MVAEDAEGKLYCGYPEDERILFYNKEHEKYQDTGLGLIVIYRKAVYNRNRYQGFWNMQVFPAVICRKKSRWIKWETWKQSRQHGKN